METYFGDLLDHYTDYIFYLGLYYLLLFKIPFKNNKKIFNYIIYINYYKYNSFRVYRTL